MARATPVDKTRELQRTLYRAAKADPHRRFHALYDKIYRRDVLERAWEQVRENGGAAGLDGITIADVDLYGAERMLDEVGDELREGRYRVQAGRRVWIPKPGTRERRPLSIPTVRDRLVQAALKIVIEPIFEADFLPCSFGFRPQRGAHDALQVLVDESWRRRRWVVETDIASCFDEIPHRQLIEAVAARISDRHVLKLIRAMLQAGVLEDGAVRRGATGTPQGGVISPLLANIYLHQLDRCWQSKRWGVLCRYADDLVVMCQSAAEARRALEALRAELGNLGLRPKDAKTRTVHLLEGGEGFDFLGFEHQWVRATGRSRHVTYLARWPSRRARQQARDRIRELTGRDRLLVPVETVVGDVNRFLRGWASYFRYGNSARHFDRMEGYAILRLALFVAKRHKRPRGYGVRAVLYASPDHYGLQRLAGLVVAPRPNKPWRVTSECWR
jgi:RNA-directed DNA polymerase